MGHRVFLGLLLLVSGCGDDGDGSAMAADGPVADGVPDAGPDAGGDPEPADGAPVGDGSGELLALTYNVAGLPELLSSSMPERFTPMIGPLLNDYDLVLLQETWRTPDPNPNEPQRVYHELLEAAAEHPHKSEPAELPFGMDADRPLALLSDGLNRFSRFPFEPVERTRWTTCVNTAADCLAIKGFSTALTTIEAGVEVQVYNLHMEAGGSDEDDAARQAGVEQLIEHIGDASAGTAVIVGGDFNLHTDREPDGSQFAFLLEHTGLTDACTELGCEQPYSIDKFLYRSGENVEIEALGWTDESDAFVSDAGEPLSDHPPIAVRFSYEAR